MASATDTTRRSIFTLAGAAFVATAVPAGAQVAQNSAWADFKAGVAAIHPDLADRAAEAEADGWQPSECWAVMANPGSIPSLMFRRPAEERGPDRPDQVWIGEKTANYQAGYSTFQRNGRVVQG